MFISVSRCRDGRGGVEVLREDNVEWSDQLKTTKITRRDSSQLARMTEMAKSGKDEGCC
jgi:hypothetical protein